MFLYVIWLFIMELGIQEMFNKCLLNRGIGLYFGLGEGRIKINVQSGQCEELWLIMEWVF